MEGGFCGKQILELRADREEQLTLRNRTNLRGRGTVARMSMPHRLNEKVRVSQMRTQRQLWRQEREWMGKYVWLADWRDSLSC